MKSDQPDYGLMVGLIPLEEDVEHEGLPGELKKQMEESARLDEVIQRNLEILGYGK